jgi:hypothetical protein
MLGLSKSYSLEHVQVTAAVLMPRHEMVVSIEAGLSLRWILGISWLVLLIEKRLTRPIYMVVIWLLLHDKLVSSLIKHVDRHNLKALISILTIHALRRKLVC